MTATLDLTVCICLYYNDANSFVNSDWTNVSLSLPKGWLLYA